MLPVIYLLLGPQLGQQSQRHRQLQVRRPLGQWPQTGQQLVLLLRRDHQQQERQTRWGQGLQQLRSKGGSSVGQLQGEAESEERRLAWKHPDIDGQCHPEARNV